MYRFNGQPNYPRNPRRGRGFFGFPWWLFFVFFWVAPSHMWWLFMVVGLIAFIIFVVARAGNSSSWTRNQQPYYQPSQPSKGQATSQMPYYQPTAGQEASQVPYYEPYQQGYQHQPPVEEALSPEGPYNTPSEPLQEEYDQPKAEYPQQMPPM